MTGEEALGILGLTQPDAAAIRAAYLRLIRIHKPDTDPDGFRRVRSAYETLTNHAVLNRSRRRESGLPKHSHSPKPASPPLPVADARKSGAKPRIASSAVLEGLRSIERSAGEASPPELEAQIDRLPAPSLDEPSPERTLRALDAALGRLLAAGRRRAASRLLSRFENWLADHGPSGRDSIRFRTAWAVRVELTQLHRDFPTPWVQRLAEATECGSYQPFLEEVSQRSLRTYLDRSAARAHLPRSGFLHQLLSERLRVRSRARMLAASRFPGAVAGWVVILMAIFASYSWVGPGQGQTSADRHRFPYAFEQELNSSFTESQGELLGNCGRVLETPECLRAATALDELAWGQCPRANADLGFLFPPRWTSLRATASKRCVAIMGKRDGEPDPKLAFRTDTELAATGLCALADQGGERWWCDYAQGMVADLKSERCPSAREVLAEFRKRLAAAPPVAPFDQAVVMDLERAEKAMRRHCEDGP